MNIVVCCSIANLIPLDLTIFFVVFFQQGDFAIEQKHAESLSGRSGHRNEW